MQEVGLHTGKRKLGFREIQVMLSHMINPTFLRTGQADLSLW